MPKRILRVFADPYAALDHEGRPAHACPTDPQHTGEIRRWVGAELAATVLPPKNKEEAESISAGRHEARQDTTFTFSDEAQELPQTPYYLERIRHGELLAADPKTARAAGIDFVEPKKRLADSRTGAIAKWFAQHEEWPPFVEETEAKALDEARAKAEAERVAAAEKVKADAPAPAAISTDAAPALSSTTKSQAKAGDAAKPAAKE